MGHCDFDEACCDMDDCSVDCPSVCDGFVDCDASTACTVSHCNDTNCKDPGAVCFDEHCYSDEDHDLQSLLGLESLPFENNLLSMSGNDQSERTSADLAHTDPNLLTPYSMNHCSSSDYHFDGHFNCKDPGTNSYCPADLNSADIFHALSACPEIFGSHNYVLSGNSCQGSGRLSSSPAPFSCLRSEYPERLVQTEVTVPGGFPSLESSRPQLQCKHHPRGHAHSFLPYPRNSHSAVPSHLFFSSERTPSPTPSALGSPELLSGQVHVCKWTASYGGKMSTCGATFVDSGALQTHLVAKHLFTTDGPKGHGYYCSWDGCSRPGEPFSQKSKLQGHFLTHSNHKSFRCGVCGKSFARQATLERHERSHRGEKPYICEECGKSFTDSSELKTHSRTHTGEKPFRCTYPGCDFQTGDSSNMSSHRLTHGERKHKCSFPGCGKSFTRPDQLKRHLRTTHKDSRSRSSSYTDGHWIPDRRVDRQHAEPGQGKKMIFN